MNNTECLMYRYRPLKSVFAHQELENQEIYFSSRKELNDPLEGYFSPFYRGDRFLWEIYLKVYARKFTEAYLEAFFPQSYLPMEVYEAIYQRVLSQPLFDKLLSYEQLAELDIAEENLKLIFSAMAPFLVEQVTFEVDAHFHMSERTDLYKRFSYIKQSICAFVAKHGAYTLTFLHTFDASAKTFFKSVVMNIRDVVLSHDHLEKGLASLYLTAPVATVENINARLTDRFRIASFSERYDNAYMWGNYAGNCEGICLAFRRAWLDEQGLQPVVYKDAKENIEAYRVLSIMQNYLIRCCSNETRQCFEEDMTTVRESYYIKLSDWREEKEYRLLLPATDDAMSLGIYVGTKIRYDLANLDSIIFGMRVSSEDRCRVIDIIAKKLQAEGTRRPFVFYEMYYDQFEDKLSKKEYYILNKDNRREMEEMASRTTGKHYEPVTLHERHGSEGKEMYALCQRLFPICRSITGEGVRKTLAIIRELIPDMTMHEVPSGTQAFDWTVPREWNIRDAWVKNEQGEKIIDFKKSNLHIMGYSLPLDKEVTREELLPMLYTQQDQPDVIPYVTSYYEERSGFCVSQIQKESLPPGKYHVYIDSDLKDGSMTYGEYVIHGDTSEEILLSTYICHPSMANNELSGPVVITWLAKWLSQMEHRRYTYRILYLPETIGPLAYMSMENHLTYMQAHVKAGFVLSCVGDSRTYSYVASRTGQTLADKALCNVLHFHYPAFKAYSFLERASDERQYNAPGVDLPVCSFCRSKYGEFPEYHTSLDNLDFISPAGLAGAYDVMQQVIMALENNNRYQVQTLGEPQLGRRGLYPTVSQKNTYNGVKAMRDFLAYADGENDLLDISNITGVPVKELLPVVHELLNAGLIKALCEVEVS